MTTDPQSAPDPAAPRSYAFYHGSKHGNWAINKIVDTQELHGEGDLGDGGYVTSDLDWAKEYGPVVAVDLRPENPYFGGEKQGDTHDTNARLREAGHDVWFPTDNVGPDISKHQFAVILDSKAATFRPYRGRRR